MKNLFRILQNIFKTPEQSNNKNLDHRSNCRPNFMEFYSNFENRNKRIKFLNSFLEYYDYGFVFPEKHKISSEPGSTEFLVDTFIHGKDRYFKYHDDYISIMKRYFSRRIDMISEVRETEYYKKIEDKTEFQKNHREFGNSMLENR